MDEDTLDGLRLELADALGADLTDDEDELEYLLEYGVRRAGAQTSEDFANWLKQAHRAAMGHMKGRSLGSRAKDVAYVLRLMEDLDAGKRR